MERRNLIIAIIFTLMGILVLIMIPFFTSARAPREGWAINVDPRTFPYIMAWIMTSMGLFNLVLAVRSYLKARMTNSLKDEKVNIFELKSVLIMFVIMFIYYLLLGRLGYIISTTMVCIAVAMFFKARWWQAILLGCVLSPVIYIIFTRVGVPLPRGLLYFF